MEIKKIFKIGLGIFSGGAFLGLGVLLEKKRSRSKNLYCGVLRIDRSEENEMPKLFLELQVPIDNLKTIKKATFLVSDKNYI